jgi:hypothetical protein
MMPNHITNVLKASKEVIDSMFNKEGEVDFNNVIPFHEDLNKFQGFGIRGGAEAAAKLICAEPLSDHPLIAGLESSNRCGIDVTKLDEKCFEQFIQMVKNKRNHGHYHGMDFTRECWGTKWNAYAQVKDSDTQVRFDTAWSCPDPVFAALSKKFPNEEINVVFADEDIGSNCGKFTMLDGEITSEDLAPNWNESDKDTQRKWTKFAFETRNPDTNPKSHGYDENWDYSDAAYEEYKKTQEA